MAIPIFNLDLTIQLAGLAIVILGSQIYYWSTYTHWSRRNVKGPPPLPFFGNFLAYVHQCRQTVETEWVRKYGKIYGTYTGSRPYLTVADAHVLRRISVKDFDKFPNRMLLGVTNKYQDNMLLLLKDDHWRGVRAIMSPTFSSSKMKVMFKKINDNSHEFLEQCESHIDHESGKGVIDLRKVVGGHIMSCAMMAFYGIEPKKINYQSLIEFSDKNRIASEQTFFRFILYSLLPWSFLRLINLPLFSEKQLEFFVKMADKIIETRKKSPGHYKDFLQLLLDARASTDDKNNNSVENQFENHHAADMVASPSNDKDNYRPVNMHLTDQEVSTQTMMFLMVSSETTLSLICHAVYLLAHHHDVQERLYKELGQLKGKQLEYEQIASLNYLDCVISETLRLMSPSISLDRIAEEDYFIKEYNITIPKGTVVNLAFYAILRDPDYWPEPEKFDPDRFLPENRSKIVPGSYCPFGVGPRACIGYRFALMEAKTSLIRLVNEFQFDKASGTIYPPEQEKASFVLNIYKNLLVTIKKRQA